MRQEGVSVTGTQFTCLTCTKVQVLTLTRLRSARDNRVCFGGRAAAAAAAAGAAAAAAAAAADAAR